MQPYDSNRGAGAASVRNRHVLRALLVGSASAAAIAVALQTAAWAGGPTGGQVVGGSAVITNPSSTSTVITQSSQKAIINWQDFSVSSGSSVQFAQPNSSAIALNRVIGPSQSLIDGTLTANGRIWIINANGVMFGAGSQVHVGSLIATTADIANGDFMSGNYAFSKVSGNPDAAIVNDGTIRAADGGSIVLAGPVVVNNGLIQADLGSVTLASGNAFAVDFQGDNLIRFAVTAPVTDTPKDKDGKAQSALVSNTGKIAAAGGRIALTARAAKNVADNVINNSGIIEARSVHNENGVIVLDAGPNGTVEDSGAIDASGRRAGETGGSVTVTGANVKLADGASIDASGKAGGGTILVGGGLQGSGSTRHAQTVEVGKASLKADATAKGDGGTIAIWSDGTTTFAGSASARGGTDGGDGGVVETSGHALQVATTARVDTTAPKGVTGTWLIDPSNISIESGGGDGIGGSHIDPTTVTGALATSNVSLQATNTISVYDDLIYDSAHSLSMLAGGDIYIAANVLNSGSGAINAIAGWDRTTTDPLLFTTSGVYGNNGGSVYVTSDYDLDPSESYASELSGEPYEVHDVAIGSASGTTTIAGSDVNVLGYFGSSRIGYQGAGGGDINVLAIYDINLTGSSDAACNYCFAQIGNGVGIFNTGNNTGNINVSAGGNIVLFSGADDYSYTQIGNGGDTTTGDVSGNLTLTAGGDVSLIADGDYAQIGNGGWGTNGNLSGSIAATIGGDLSMTGGTTTSWGYAQLGNGGQRSTGAASGDLDVSVGGNLVMTAGDSSSHSGNTVQIGNGSVTNLTAGDGASSASGSITIDIAGDSTLSSGPAGNDFWIGNIDGNAVSSGGTLILLTGTLDYSGDTLGDFPMMLVSDLTGGDVTLGLRGDDLALLSSLTYSSDHALSLLASGDATFTASIQNSGAGAVNVVAGWDGTTLSSAHFGDAGVYGNNSGSVVIGGSGAASDVALGSAGGTTQIAGDDVTISGVNGYAQAGYRGTGSGSIEVYSSGLLSLTGNSSSHVAAIGNGTGSTSSFVEGGGNVTIQADAISLDANHAVAGNTASLTVTGNDDLGSAAIPLRIWVDGIALTTNGGNAYLIAPQSGVSIGVGGIGVDLGGGDFSLTAAGDIGQTASLQAGTTTIEADGGAITLTNAGNTVGPLTLSTTGSDSASFTNAGALTLAGADVGGTLTLTGTGTVGQSGAITANALDVSSSGGAITLTNSGNTFGNLTVVTSGSNNASITDATALTVAGADVGGTLTLTGTGAIGQSGAILANALDVSSSGGAIALNNSGNSFSTLTVGTSGSNNASITDATALTVAGAMSAAR